MKNKFLNFACRRCKSTAAKWTRLLPTNVHAYRVTCSRCDCFVGWGNERQRQQLFLLTGRSKLYCRCQPPGATLEGWFK